MPNEPPNKLPGPVPPLRADSGPSITFKGQTEADVWLRFAVESLHGEGHVEAAKVARSADAMLEEYRKRWSSELPPPTAAPGLGWPPDPKRSKR